MGRYFKSCLILLGGLLLNISLEKLPLLWQSNNYTKKSNALFLAVSVYYCALLTNTYSGWFIAGKKVNVKFKVYH